MPATLDSDEIGAIECSQLAQDIGVAVVRMPIDPNQRQPTYRLMGAIECESSIELNPLAIGSLGYNSRRLT